MTAWLIKLAGPLLAAALLVAASVYLGNLSSRARSADQLKLELKSAQDINQKLVVKAAAANKARLEAGARAEALEASLDEALKKRIAPTVVRRIAPPGTRCLSDDAVRMLNATVADGNRAVRAAANGLDDAAR